MVERKFFLLNVRWFVGHSKAIRKEARVSYQLMIFTQSYSSAMCREALASSKACLVEDTAPTLPTLLSFEGLAQRKVNSAEL